VGSGLGEDQKLVTFEIASFDLDDQAEKIMYVKFLDDNDPRLLLLVTYHDTLETTYMKVIKIEKNKTAAERTAYNQGRPQKETGQSLGIDLGNDKAKSKDEAPARRRSFSYYENKAFNQLK
jgi:hypothetical protein